MTLNGKCFQNSVPCHALYFDMKLSSVVAGFSKQYEYYSVPCIVESLRGALAHLQVLTALQLVSLLSQLVWPESPSHILLIPAICPLTISFKRIQSKIDLEFNYENKTHTFGLSVKLPPDNCSHQKRPSDTLKTLRTFLHYNKVVVTSKPDVHVPLDISIMCVTHLWGYSKTS